MKKFLAFTLAETLIVIGIIGVVSALTLPNLNSSTGDKERIVKFKKFYQNYTDAIGRAEAVYGPYETWFINDTDEVAKEKRANERITEFMKVQKTCLPNTNGCFSSSEVKSISGQKKLEADFFKSHYSYILADGTSFGFVGNVCVHFDIDGPNKGKNIVGIDIFEFELDSNTANVWIHDNLASSGAFGKCYNDGYPPACVSWIITLDNMEYLKANSDGKCKNNTNITLDGVTNTTCK